jgi:glycolate oxidase
MTASPRNFPAGQVIEALHAALPADIIRTDADTCVLMAQDVFTKALPALAVVSPTTVEQLSAAVLAATSAGAAVVPRGGGMSYTSGYVPAEADSVVIDMSRLDAIVEINTADMYVVVEAGCTWAKLHEALQPLGLRTPFWGTLSGRFATIGGGASQNCLFWGCGLHGTGVESILGMEIVTGDGRLVSTGMMGRAGATPFQRHYGPDLTGLFTADTGAMGFKARIALRLIPEAQALRFLSFSFERYDDLFPAMSEIARQGLASECFAFDPFLQGQRMKRESLAKDVKALANVMRASGSVFGALKDAAQIALAGRSFLDDVPYSLHVIVEGRHGAAADADVRIVEDICAKAGGTSIDNSIPKILRANPFGPVNSMVGPEGERWVPVHGMVPHSKAVETMRAIEAVFAAHQTQIDAYDIGCGYLCLTVGHGTFLIEPVFFWPDAMTEIHRTYVEADHLANLKGFAENLAARALVESMREAIIAAFQTHGAAHLQIGKAYPYRSGLTPATDALLQAVKRQIDPQARINPGSLGL